MHTTQDSPVESNGRLVSPPPLFAITAAKKGGSYVICVKGELDLSECPHLEHAIQRAEASHAIRILLDLEKLTFIDAAGLNVLVMAWRRSVSNGDRLRVTRGRDSVASMLHLTALDTVLPFSHT
jgi:anti-sigma B factor antagonist